jgi:hypothetical protein
MIGFLDPEPRAISYRGIPTMAHVGGNGKEDRNVARSAQQLLEHQLRKMIRDVACDLNDESLVIKGRTNSFYHKQLAQEAVRAVAGKLKVINQIEVVARIP